MTRSKIDVSFGRIIEEEILRIVALRKSKFRGQLWKGRGLVA